MRQGLPFHDLVLWSDEYVWAAEGVTGGMGYGLMYLKFTTNKGRTVGECAAHRAAALFAAAMYAAAVLQPCCVCLSAVP